jgi:hypothetical protein
LNPAVERSTMNAVTPPWKPLAMSVTAKTTTTSATGPFEMNVFVPFRRQPPSSRCARMCIAKVSEPESGSVMACAPMKVPSHRRRR